MKGKTQLCFYRAKSDQLTPSQLDLRPPARPPQCLHIDGLYQLELLWSS